MKSNLDAQHHPRHRILVIDDHPFIRQAIRQLLDAEPDLEMCGEAEHPAQSLAVVERSHPDLVLLDLSLGSSDGLSLIKAIRSHYARLPILILSLHSAALFAERALRAGANGYIMKSEAAEDLIKAIHCVLQGQIYVSNGIRKTILNRIRNSDTHPEDTPVERLSDRELEVMQLIGTGSSTSDIARLLEVSVKTVETHRAHIKSKLSLSTNHSLVLMARQWVEQQAVH